MRVSLKNLVAALAVVLGLSMFASPGEARPAFYAGGGDGIVMVRDHGHGYRGHGGYYQRHGFLGDRRHYRGGRHHYRGGFYRDRGFYGRRHHRGARFYGRHHRYWIAVAIAAKRVEDAY